MKKTYTVELHYRLGDRVRVPGRRTIGTIQHIEWNWSEADDRPGRAIYTVIFDRSPEAVAAGRPYGPRRYVTVDELTPEEDYE
jgi:hypothetical protein